MADCFKCSITVLLIAFYTSLINAQATPDCRGQKADIIFLLDSSTSEGQQNFNRQLDFVKNLTTIYDIGPNNVQIGLTSFSSHVNYQFWLNSYHNEVSLQSAINHVPYISGNTNTGEGINFVTTQGFSSTHGMRTDVTHIMVVMTDGQSQDGQGTATMAAQAHQAGIEVVAIGIGNGVSMSELQAIASDSKHVLTVDSFLALASIQHSLAATTCNTCKTAEADVVFILDSSGSEGLPNFQKELQFVSNFVNNANIGPQNIQVGLVTFSDIVKNEFYLDTYHNKIDIMAKLQNVSYRGSTTHTELGLQYARLYQFSSSHGLRPNAKKIAVVLTDGQSQSRATTLSEATLLKQQGVTVISVGIGTQVSQTEIDGIASDTNHVFTVATFDALHTIQSELENTACGGTAPPVTTVSTECGTKPADIVFILDSSGSEGSSNFNKQLQFMTDFVTNFKIGPHDVQFGLVTFSIDALNEFYLNTYNNQQDIVNKLQNIAYIGSTTHTELGLQYARRFQFSVTHGARHNAQKIAIVLTDGQSQSRTDTIHEADLLKQMGVKIISIGIGNGIAQTELVSMATDQQHVFNVDNFDALHTIQSEIKDSACGGGGGTSPTGTSSACTADVVFAIDASGAEGPSNFQKSLSFMSEVVNEFPNSPGDVQFGLVTFGARASASVELLQYHSKSALISAIQRTPYIGGAQDSWVGLHLVRTHTLTPARGARTGVKAFVILITNGPSSSHSLFVREATKLHQTTNMTGIAIGIGNGLNMNEFNALALDGHHTYHISSANALTSLRHMIHDAICAGTSPALTTPLPGIATTAIGKA
ncbi:collagen alpha-1(XII) chain-like [Ylistrum balloti]|uniref:collagen alpha-1(XII) chain-like n=1 Tax=Ylistrum balloti TaxID=509963 RepID=UPI0029058586|nr:collagen alpha-1(XII) chain-like [Ylistrum balloti]